MLSKGIIFFTYLTITILLTFLSKSINSVELTCNTYKCDSTHAKCIGYLNATCLCDNHYDTYPEDGVTMCNYTKKSQLQALLLELLLTFGAGHYYLERYVNAIFKTIFWLVGIFLFIALRIYNKDNNNDNDDDLDNKNDDEDSGVENLSSNTLMVALFGCIFCVGILVWQIIDIIMFSLNLYKDENGIDLLSW